MAYTLKSTGLATSLVMCVAIDDDGTTVTEFVNSTINANKTVDTANMTFGSSSWKGTSRPYFGTEKNGDFGFYGVKFPSGSRPTLAMNNASGVGFFAAVAGSAARGGNGVFFSYTGDAAEGDGGMARTSTSKAAWWISSEYKGASTSSLPLDDTPFSVGGNFDNDTGVEYFYGLETGSLAADGNSSAGTGFGGATGSVYGLGGATGFGSQPMKYHVAAFFNRTLTLSEYQSLHDDWFGTLFEESGATINLTGANSTQANTGSTGAISVDSGATITTDAFKLNNGQLRTGMTGLTVTVLDLDTMAHVVTLTDQTTHASTAVMEFTDDSLVAGTWYVVVTKNAAGVIGAQKYQAA